MGAVPEMKEKPVIYVKMPMTKDPDILEQAHKDGTEILIRELEGREEGYSDGRRLITGKPPRAVLSEVLFE